MPGAVPEAAPLDAPRAEGRVGSSTRGRAVEGCARVSGPGVGMGVVGGLLTLQDIVVMMFGLVIDASALMRFAG